jgi:hypothetical protein
MEFWVHCIQTWRYSVEGRRDFLCRQGCLIHTVLWNFFNILFYKIWAYIKWQIKCKRTLIGVCLATVKFEKIKWFFYSHYLIFLLFFEIHTVQRRRAQHARTLTPYEYTYAKPTTMRTSEGLSTDRFGDSRSHHWRLVVDGNVAYDLTHNAGKSRNKF